MFIIPALKAAAELGLRVHRDVSPSNIILCTDKKTGTSNPRRGYLCDWDLSRAGAQSEDSTREDESGTWSTLWEDYEVSVCDLWMHRSAYADVVRLGDVAVPAYRYSHLCGGAADWEAHYCS